MGLPSLWVYLDSRPMYKITQTITDEKRFIKQTNERKMLMKKLKYYWFCVKWLWKNRDWDNTRQKFKAMEKAYRKEGRDT